MFFPSKINSMEEWRDIPGYECLYKVSNLGRIKRNGRLKTFRLDRGGYLTVWLCKDSEQKNYKVHRLVAQAFIPNPNNKLTVNHIDGYKQNNAVENLEWATHSENIIHANKTGLRTVTEAQRRAARETGKKTCELNRRHRPVFCRIDDVCHEFESVREGARFVSGNASAIVRCCKGKAKTYKGYEWGYA